MNKTFIFMGDSVVVVNSGCDVCIDLRDEYPKFGELADERIAYNDRKEKEAKRYDYSKRPNEDEEELKAPEHYFPDWYLNMT